MLTRRVLRWCIPAAAGLTLLLADPALAYEALNHTTTSSTCTSAYTLNGNAAKPSAAFKTTFTWNRDPSGDATSMRTAVHGNDNNSGSAGLLCADGRTAKTWKIKVWADYTVQAYTPDCSNQITSSLPGGVSVSRSCSGNTSSLTASFVFSCQAANGLNSCSSDLGGMTFKAPTGGWLSGFGRQTSMQLWKSSSSNGFPFSSEFCGTNPFIGGVHCA
jgi:hypothetical protein